MKKRNSNNLVNEGNYWRTTINTHTWIPFSEQDKSTCLLRLIWCIQQHSLNLLLLICIRKTVSLLIYVLWISSALGITSVLRWCWEQPQDDTGWTFYLRMLYTAMSEWPSSLITVCSSGPASLLLSVNCSGSEIDLELVLFGSKVNT